LEIQEDLAKLAKKIKVIVSDVDGVLNDCTLYVDANGVESFGSFNIYDGFGVVMAHECGLKVIVISGRQSACTIARCKNLGIDEVHTGITDKKTKLQEIAGRLNLSFDEMAYIGDDLIDLKAMNLVGFKAAPKTAMLEIRNRVDYVTNTGCGDGALRELIEFILHAQGLYQDYMTNFV
jgi:3-deoxy-D-manno-octulosonate 8-phosphate phosphatase (KDO 8-P phosphatase)